MKIIGSERVFNVDNLLPFESKLFSLLKEHKIVFFSSGRSAIYNALKNEIKTSSLFFPDFYCNEMLNPILKAGIDVIFYSIKQDMSADLEIFNKIKNVKTIYINDYSGFRDNELFDFAKRRKMKIIIDRTHSLLSNFDFSKHIQIASLRKMIPVPDGGIILNGEYNYKKRERDYNFYSDKINSKLQRFIYETFSPNEKTEINYVRLSEMSEKNIKINSKNISLFSEKFFSAYDTYKAAALRRNNYSILLSSKEIKKRAIFKNLDSLIVPQSFPIFVSKRDIFKKKLSENNIFAPVLWRCENSISDSIINIPLDEEYDENDMYKTIRTIEKILKMEI